MSQVDYIISNDTRTAVRSDLNATFAAIVTNNSGATEPTTMYSYQWWADTTTGILKMRNAGNTAWISMFTIATGAWLGNAATATTAAACSGNSATATTATTATGATNIDISATTSTDTTTSIVLVAAQATGNQSPFIDSGLTYNANTNSLDVSGDITSSSVRSNGPLTIFSTSLVVNLPAGVFGKKLFVTDATSTTFHSIVAGGGANTVPVWYDGSNWRIG